MRRLEPHKSTVFQGYMQRKKLHELRHTGVAIEINGSQFFEHVRAIYLPNESFGEKNPDCF